MALLAKIITLPVSTISPSLIGALNFHVLLARVTGTQFLCTHYQLM